MLSARTDAASRAPTSLHFEQLDLEQERGVRRNDAARAARAVAELWRDQQRTRAANFHAGDAFIPTFEDTTRADGERERATTIPRAVEFFALRLVRPLEAR